MTADSANPVFDAMGDPVRLPSGYAPHRHGRGQDAGADAVQAALAAVGEAAAGFPAWSVLAPTERRARLMRAAEMLEKRLSEFAAVMAEETGATAGWARFNVELGAAMLREAAAMTTQITGSVIPSDRPGATALALRQPVGVVLGIAPWNAPVVLAARAVAMALACGNTVVLKASEITPNVHELLSRTLNDAGIDNGALTLVTNPPADAARVVEALIGHPAIRRVNFTGSTRIGRLVAEVAARHLKPVLLELGGKAPLLVLDDADLDEAVKAASFSAFMNQGQICMSTERMVVDDRVADQFVERIARRASGLLAGDPHLTNAALGPVVGHDAIQRIDGLVKDAVAKGARVIAGGRIDGRYMDATVIDDITPSMRIYHEECFGPVAAIIRVNGDEEAIRVANDTEYGLASAVFSRDLGRALKVAQRVEAGICHINGPTVQDEPQMPFGGMKASGFGRFGGERAIDEFTELRWITYSTRPAEYPI